MLYPAPSFDFKQTLFTTSRTDDDGRKVPVDMWVIHETVGAYPGSLNWLIGSMKASCDWYIRRDGKIYRLSQDGQATAHAGVCEFGTKKSTDKYHEWGWANIHGEGVEMEGPNDGTPFTLAQYNALLALTRWRVEVNKIPRERIVTHGQIGFPRGRKTDPKGLDFARFKRDLYPPVLPAPAVSAEIGGAGRSFKCHPTFKAFYDKHGGLLVFGFATSDQFEELDPDGELCQYMRFENAAIKSKPSMPESWRIRPIQITELVSMLKKAGQI